MKSGVFIALKSSRKLINRGFMPLNLGKFMYIKKHNRIIFIPPLSIVLVLLLKIDVCVLTHFSVSCLFIIST